MYGMSKDSGLVTVRVPVRAREQAPESEEDRDRDKREREGRKKSRTSFLVILLCEAMGSEMLSHRVSQPLLRDIRFGLRAIRAPLSVRIGGWTDYFVLWPWLDIYLVSARRIRYEPTSFFFFSKQYMPVLCRNQ
jgi:hypothetical protein